MEARRVEMLPELRGNDLRSSGYYRGDKRYRHAFAVAKGGEQIEPWPQLQQAMP
jgi:hypothetical protein